MADQIIVLDGGRVAESGDHQSLIGQGGTYAELFALRRQAGRPTAPQDIMIAAIARANSARMVTRDTGDFEGCGLTLINPWEAA